MRRPDDLVLLALTHPDELPKLHLADWDLLIRQARSAGMLGRIHAALDEAALLDAAPRAPRAHLAAAAIIASSQERVVRWEVRCIERALSEAGTETILLKGAAYVLAGFPIARGRLQSDIDILVPWPKLKDVEASLRRHGWQDLKLEKYDQRFYRQWSHELPPLYHPQRSTVVDVHHNILPRTGRLRPDSRKLLDAAQSIPGTRFKRLSDPDMVLHAAAHMFQDGDLNAGWRELSDIDGMVRLLGKRVGFWEELLQRAPEMDLARPLFYALRYSNRFLYTPIPASAASTIQKWGPTGAVLRVMDATVLRALSPRRPEKTRPGTEAARWFLYARSHWLRMPPLLLARHLTHKLLKV